MRHAEGKGKLQHFISKYLLKYYEHHKTVDI